MTGEISRAFGRLETTIQRTLQECGGGAGIKYLSHMGRNKKAPLHARKSVYTNSLWAYVWQMDRHRSESNKCQSGVCTKSARRRFRTQDLRFVER